MKTQIIVKYKTILTPEVVASMPVPQHCRKVISTMNIIQIFFLFFAHPVFPQKYTEPDRLKTFNIVVNYDTYTVKTQMLKDAKKIKVLDDRTYVWCSASKILETKGGYDGKLLHGYYKSFYAENGQLRESGVIKYGLRGKEWRYWYADGNLKEIVHYKQGKKSGTYMLYNDYGHLMAKGRFKEDLLHGSFYTYNASGTVMEKKRYKRGMELIKMKRPKKIKKGTKQTNAEAGRPAPEKRTDKSSQKKEQARTQPSVDRKRSFGQKIRDLFKKKEKPAEPREKKPVSTSV